ncbi:MAG TPA: FAD-dependent oxidoreductase [Tepidisphaeraceae bacterium]|nr:FAD-dependent oxidoreductase [Tepidisphaeraceae bacterium]
MRSIQSALCAAFLSIVLPFATTAQPEPRRHSVDVCVYGGTSAGVIAAVAVAKEGKSVILVEPGRHLGGMSSGGLGWTDFGNKAVIGGLSLDFYQRVGRAYGRQEAAWTFEPRVAENVFHQIVAEHKVIVLFEHRLRSVQKDGARLASATFEHAPPQPSGAPAPAAQPDSPELIVAAKMFLDCTYEGDLMAKAGVSYAVGRESVAQYGEPLNGIRAETPKHQFLGPVDPYVVPGDPSSGLLPLVQEGDGGKPGDGDKRVQTYNFRLCLTQEPSNKLPITAPPDYDPKRYELLARHVQSLEKTGKLDKLSGRAPLLKIDMVTPKKTDINNNGAVSTDHIGANYDYPDADYARRAEIWNDHLHYIQGMLHFLGTDPRVPGHIRTEMRSWGLCKDEFQDTGGWPHQMYVREARRMVGPYVVTQADCEHKRVAEDPVGMGAYNMDSHNCQRIVKDGVARNEGDVQVGPKGPYPIPYRALTPKRGECDNLLVPVCFSCTHIAYGSARMEPVFMVLGESSAYAALQAIESGKAVQDVDYPKLREKLLKAGQVLQYKAPAKK